MNPEKHNGRTIQDIQSAPLDNAGAVNALPSQEHVMTARRLKVGVVGASISNSPDGRERYAVRAHVPALKHLSDLFEVVAICTTRMDTASAAAKHFDVPHAYDSVERMLKEVPEIDVVCVSVNPGQHYQVVMAALNAGKHVYCEQALGVSTAQAQEMYELARRKNVRTVVGNQPHFEPAVLQMIEMAQNGYIGKPLSFNITYFASAHIAPRPSHRTWLFSAEACGHPGFRSNHSLERVMSVLGDVKEICADMAVLVPERPNLDGGPPLKTTVTNNINYLLRVGDNVMGTLQVCLTAWFGTGYGFQVYGTEGMLMLAVQDTGEKNTVAGDPMHGELRLYGNRVDMKQLMANPTAPELLQRQFKEIQPDAKHCYVTGIDQGRGLFAVAQMWHAFAHAIHTGTECPTNFRNQLKIHCVWDATEQSMRDRSWAKVDYSRLGA
jgi:predicted dehydrogenase